MQRVSQSAHAYSRTRLEHLRLYVYQSGRHSITAAGREPTIERQQQTPGLSMAEVARQLIADRPKETWPKHDLLARAMRARSKELA